MVPLITTQYSLASPVFLPSTLAAPQTTVPLIPWVPSSATHVVYTHYERAPGGGVDSDVIPADTLTYHDGTQAKTFAGGEISDQALPTGSILTVQLTGPSDAGASYFSLLLPPPPEGSGTTSLTALGVTVRKTGPDVIPRNTTTYSATILTGSCVRS